MAESIVVKQKEAKTVSFTISGTFSLAAAVFKFGMKENYADAVYLIEKDDVDFDKSEIATRVVKITLETTDLDQVAGNYLSELKITLAADNIDKSTDIPFVVESAVTHN